MLIFKYNSVGVIYTFNQYTSERWNRFVFINNKKKYVGIIKNINFNNILKIYNFNTILLMNY